jgi:hypothetical protein
VEPVSNKPSPLFRALRYAEQVTTGKIPDCIYVQQACERQLRDLSRRRLLFVPFETPPREHLRADKL